MSLPADIPVDAPPLPAVVERIFISPGHNFFGRKVPDADSHPLLEVSEVRCLAGRGLEGDRFLDFKDNYSGQVTFFDLAVFDELVRALGIHDKIPGVLRRNVFLRGVDLNEWADRRFSLQGIVFDGAKEAAPCAWMDLAFGPGAHEFLKGRGGLRARIVTTGALRVRMP
jgi:MOSC domain-containing protein YiiM